MGGGGAAQQEGLEEGEGIALLAGDEVHATYRLASGAMGWGSLSCTSPSHRSEALARPDVPVALPAAPAAGVPPAPSGARA